MSIAKLKLQLLKVTAKPTAALMSLFLVSVFAVSSSVQADIAYVPVRVIATSTQTATVTFTPPPGVVNLTGASGAVTLNVDTTFMFNLSGSTQISHRTQRAGAGASANFARGNISLKLPSEQYQNAAVSLYAINGRRVFKSTTGAAAGSLNRSLTNIPAGVYLISVKGVNGNTFSSRLSHSGGKLNLNVAFTGGTLSFDRLAAAMAVNNEWTVTATLGSTNVSDRIIIERGNNPHLYITFSGSGNNARGTIEVPPSRLPDVETVAARPLPSPAANYTETVAGQNFQMIYIPGGTFTLGCSNCGNFPPDVSPVTGVTVSPYYISARTVNDALWNAVMGRDLSSMTWYDAMIFACRLSKMTGRNYRMQTEAEYEYAVKRHKSSLTIGTCGMMCEEWAYNTWSGTHSGGSDPVGSASGEHTQKTRRNAAGYPDSLGRLIRSIEGIGPALRLVVSANGSFPPGYVPPCDIHAPEMEREPVNSYRDMRWVTGSDFAWRAVTASGQSAGSFDFSFWEDGTAQVRSTFGMNTTTNGQWFTSNNITLVFVPSTVNANSPVRRYPYVMVDETHASLLSAPASVNFFGRIQKVAATGINKPNVSGLMTGEVLARAQGADFETYYKMVDMTRITETHRNVQDAMLIDGPNHGWFQNNERYGGTHHYRKDVDADEFRFVVNDRGNNMLANGSWFTVNNTFLRVTHSTGYVVDYVYTVTDNEFRHNSFMGYERGDFRMFEKVSNSAYTFPCTGCNQEIAKGGGASMYAGMFARRVSLSTFVPAPCPTSGCN